MQPLSEEHRAGTRLSTSSHSSTSLSKNTLLHGLFSSPPLNNIPSTISNLHSTPSRLLNTSNQRWTKAKRAKELLLIATLASILAFLLVLTIELGTSMVTSTRALHSVSNLTSNENGTRSTEETSRPLRSFFACVWLFNVLLLVIHLFWHLSTNPSCSAPNQLRFSRLRDLIEIYDHVNTRSTRMAHFSDTCSRTSLLCFLWYFASYLMFRSMPILVPSQLLVLYSMIVTLRQILGWIFLQEEFHGNKIIGHILSLSALLCLAHNDGFRFNRFLFGLFMVTCAVISRTTFDILLHCFIKDLTAIQWRLTMINVGLCGTFFLWPLIILLHLTDVEPIDRLYHLWLIGGLAMLGALAWNVVPMVIPGKDRSIVCVSSFLVAIPCVSIVDAYRLEMTYSPLVLSGMISALAAILLSIIPKRWFDPGEAMRMKQALGIGNKDPTIAGVNGNLSALGGTSSAFEEIRAQRRIRNALLYNQMKT